jgi:ABC-type branched-subunit amino acid transport system ATPase component
VTAIDTTTDTPPDGVNVRPVLVCQGVEVAYDGVQVLFGVDLEVAEGEIIALLGTNGAGKSTLLKAISGLVDPIGGTIFFDGEDITHADAVTTSRMGILQVPGGKAVFPTLSVEEHFRVGSWLLTKEDPKEVAHRQEVVLSQFPRLKERWGQLAGNLSGGEQQQLALAMVFVARPRLLVIDELTLGLAPTVVDQLLILVQAIHDQGCTIIIVEQSVNVALSLASRAYFMEKGEVRFSGLTSELMERSDILRSVFLQGASVGAAATAPSPVAARARHATLEEQPAVLEVQGLTKKFGGIVAVDDVTFVLRQGEILGLIGPNGAGKTTIVDLISGLLSADGGSVRLLGNNVTRWGPDRRAAHGLGRSFQDARIFPSLTVAENIAIGLERHIEVRDHLSSMMYLPAMQDSEADVLFTVNELVELLNLGAFRDKFVSELSTGSRRETEALGPLLESIQAETGCSMLVIEHDMPLITSISDEMMALDLGAVVVRGTPDEVINDPHVIESYLGTGGVATMRSGAVS